YHHSKRWEDITYFRSQSVLTKGGITDSATISFDEIISLYFSLKDEYRNNAVFIMHDNTAMLLRTLKDTSGSYLWNSSDNTICGKPVVTSPYMPTVSAGAKSIVIGDLSYYWLIERQPITIKKLTRISKVRQISVFLHVKSDVFHFHTSYWKRK
ncbi:phage major capsid protein, partial [Brevibacillus agri]